MKNLFLALTFLLSAFTTVIAQQYTVDSNHGEWRYLHGERYLYLYNSNGTGVENFNEIPDFTIRFEKNGEGTINVRLDGALIYSYDKSEKNQNFVEVDIIIDNGDLVSFNGRIAQVENKDRTRIYLSSPEDGPRFSDLFKDMKRGREIFVKTTGAKASKVFKYSLTGFSSGMEKLFLSWSSWKETYNNPFNSKNPFDR